MNNEPVAWMAVDFQGNHILPFCEKADALMALGSYKAKPLYISTPNCNAIPLYTHPAKTLTLTDSELHILFSLVLDGLIENASQHTKEMAIKEVHRYLAILRKEQEK